MKKLDFPEGYEVYHIDQEQLFVVDETNHRLISDEKMKKAFSSHFFPYTPEDKEVECFVMDYDEEANTYRVNFEKKARIKMNLLESLPYWISH